MILDLSKKFTNEGDLRDLATKGLNVPEHITDRHLYNERHDISMAAIKVLKAWQKGMEGPEEAYAVLYDALKKVGLVALANVLK